MEQQLFDTLHYFLRFQYPPTISEVHRYIQLRVSELELKNEIYRLQSTGTVRIENDRVFLIDRNYDGYFVRNQQSDEMLAVARSYISNLEYIPTIELIGISGSMSMHNGTSLDDIDLFIITKAGSIWTTRFFVLLYKKLLGFINPKISNKLCFNLFFSEEGLEIKENKQNVYVAHEILQLKVVYNKKGMYHRFLSANNWVNVLFPNAQLRFDESLDKLQSSQQVSRLMESMIGAIQKWWLRRIHYTYIEKDGQLWLIQKDWNTEG